MNNLFSIALRYLKMNRRQSVFIIICASLSVTLCAFFLTAFSTAFATVRENTTEFHGSWHAVIYGLTKEQADKLAANAAFSDVQIRGDLYQRQIVEIKDFMGSLLEPDDDGYIHSLYACGTAELIGWGMVLTAENDPGALYTPDLFSGRLPESPYEIVLPAYASEKIGDKITVNIRSHWRVKDSRGIDRPGQLSKSYEKSYTVCGISGKKNPDCTYIHIDDDFFTKGVMERRYSLFVRFADKRENYRTLLMELCGNEGIPVSNIGNAISAFVKYENNLGYGMDEQFRQPNSIKFHRELLNSEISGSEAIVDMSGAFSLICLFIMMILAFGRVVIDCEFEQIASSKRHDIGLLMAIGAEDRQLIRVSIIEGLLLGAAAVPAGLLMGVGLAALAVKILNGIFYMKDIFPVLVVFDVDPLLLLLAAVMGIGWVFFSSYGIGVSIKKVNAVEAMEGVRKSGRSPYPEQNAANPELYKKLHAAFILTPVKKGDKGGRVKRRVILTPFDKLTPENFLQRLSAAIARIERKRFRAASASMAMGIFIFTAVFYVQWTAGHSLGFRLNQKTEEEVSSLYYAETTKYMPADDTDGYLKLVESAAANGIEIGNYRYWGRPEDYTDFKCTVEGISANAHAYDKEKFEGFENTFLKNTGITYEEAAENNYILVFPNSYDYDQSLQPRVTVKKAAVNYIPDTVSGVSGWKLWGMRDEGYEEISREETIVFFERDGDAVLSTEYERIGTGFYSGGKMQSGAVYLPEEYMNALKRETVEAYPETKYFSTLPVRIFVRLKEGKSRSEAEEWLRENVGYLDVYSYYEEPLLYVLFKVVGVILTVTAALIAFANAVNVTMSGILENRRGFALMRAAGMTDKQLESSSLWQAAEPVIWAAVIAFVLSSIMIVTVWGNFGDLQISAIFIGYLAYFIGVAVTLGVSLLSALPAVREIENTEIAEGVKPIIV